MKRWRTSEMSAVAQQARPWGGGGGIACGVLFDFLSEDGFLVVFHCRLLPLLSPGCVGGADKSPLFSVARRKKKIKRTTRAFGRIYRPGGRGGGGGGGGKEGGGGGERREAVKPRSSLKWINCNQSHRTGDASRR